MCSFFSWLEQRGIGGLVDIEPFHVAAYIKALKVSDAGNPAVKERAAATPGDGAREAFLCGSRRAQ